MKIRDYIKQQFTERLDTSECLVVYDLEQRYKELIHEMASARCTVVDGSESTISGREQAMRACGGQREARAAHVVRGEVVERATRAPALQRGGVLQQMS